VIRAVDVWVDAAGSELRQVGSLHDDRGQIRFRYAPAWLSSAEAFALDPDLTLDAAPFFPRPDMGNFGVFLDSSPDRWGRTLMNRRPPASSRLKA
jgi:serine/threonine-protein kinase HipA